MVKACPVAKYKVKGQGNILCLFKTGRNYTVTWERAWMQGGVKNWGY